MKKINFIITYDIADKKRVGKIGKICEKEAIRIQRSVYLYNSPTPQHLQELIAQIMTVFDPEEDDMRIYRVGDYTLHLGSAINLNNPYLI